MKRRAFGRVPLFSHREFELYETQAILRYLDRVIPAPRLAPSDPRTEARMNQLCGITDCYVMPYITMGIAYDRVVAPKLGLPIDEAKIKSFMARARTCLAEISRLVGDQEFLAGPSVSIADLMLPPHLAFFSIAPEGTDLLASFPTLTAWLDRMSLLPSLINTTPEKLTTLAQLSAG